MRPRVTIESALMLLKLHLIETAEIIFDDDGRDFPNIEAAHQEAIRAIRDIVAEEIKNRGHADLDRRIDITEVDGSLMLCVPFTDVVTVGRPPAEQIHLVNVRPA